MKPTEIEFDAQEDVLDRGQRRRQLIIAEQIAKLRGEKNRWVDFWLRVNIDLPNSNVRCDSQVIPIRMSTKST